MQGNECKTVRLGSLKDGDDSKQVLSHKNSGCSGLRHWIFTAASRLMDANATVSSVFRVKGPLMSKLLQKDSRDGLSTVYQVAINDLTAQVKSRGTVIKKKTKFLPCKYSTWLRILILIMH